MIVSVRVDVDMLNRMDATIPLSDAQSRNDYIKKAIQFYTVYLQLEGDPNIFSKVVGDIVESKMTYVVSKTEVDRKKDIDRIARSQFKIAAELAKIGMVLCHSLDIPAEQLESLHHKAVEEVKSINGVLVFEDRVE